MSSVAHKKKANRRKVTRYSSNVFAMFTQPQIQEFKEAFNMIDQNRDGFVCKDDLMEMFTSLGKNPTDENLETMMNDAPGALNFTMFLTMFGERLTGTDPEETISNAFQIFDHTGEGYVDEEMLRHAFTTMGDRWSDDMVDQLFDAAWRERSAAGMLDYNRLVRRIKHGGDDEEDAAAARRDTTTELAAAAARRELLFASPSVTSPPVTSPPVTSPPVTSPPVTSPPVVPPAAAPALKWADVEPEKLAPKVDKPTPVPRKIAEVPEESSKERQPSPPKTPKSATKRASNAFLKNRQSRTDVPKNISSPIQQDIPTTFEEKPTKTSSTSETQPENKSSPKKPSLPPSGSKQQNTNTPSDGSTKLSNAPRRISALRNFTANDDDDVPAVKPPPTELSRSARSSVGDRVNAMKSVLSAGKVETTPGDSKKAGAANASARREQEKKSEKPGKRAK